MSTEIVEWEHDNIEWEDGSYIKTRLIDNRCLEIQANKAGLISLSKHCLK